MSPCTKVHFSRGDELSSDNRIHPGNKALLAAGDGVLFFVRVLLDSLRPMNPKDDISKCRWYNVNNLFSRTAFESS